MKPYSTIAGLIENLEAEIEQLNNDILTLKRKPKSFNEQILLKYIDTGSTGKVKEFVRASGVNTGQGSMYSSSDVTKLIKDGGSDISPELLTIARKVFSMKKKGGPKSR